MSLNSTSPESGSTPCIRSRWTLSPKRRSFRGSFNSAPLDESCSREARPLHFTRRFREDFSFLAADSREELPGTRLLSSSIQKPMSNASDLGLHFYEGSSATCPSMGFSSPSTSRDVSSDLHRVFLTRLCSVFRFSRPLDALLRSRPLGLVSCRIRPWGLCSQRFPPPGSCHGFFFTKTSLVRHRLARRRVPSLLLSEHRRSSPTLPPDSAEDSGIQEVRSRWDGVIRDPSVDPLSTFLAPPRFSPSSLGRALTPPTLMGYLVTLDFSIATIALQSVKEHEGRLISFENRLPPWGLRPGSIPTY